MTYKETCDWMFSQLPMYQRQGNAAYKADLSNTVLLMNHLDNPQKKFKSVHIAGTNGKGSTAHMIAAVLIASGYRVGLYTSPHLKDFRERIRIDGKPISERAVVDFISENKSFFQKESLSFFEMTVGMAFDYFSKERVDIAVIEVGLGGRLDSTNIIDPELSVITNIGLDHTQFLGDTLSKIASEKGGVIKKNTPLVVGQFQNETFPVFKQIANEKNAPIYSAFEGKTPDWTLDLLGSYQKFNAKTAFKALKLLETQFGFSAISDQSIENGFSRVVEMTGLQGRWQVLNEHPLTVCDTAHNKEGLTYTLTQALSLNKRNIHFVIGMVNDKNLVEIIELFPKNGLYYFCAAKINRAVPASELEREFSRYNLHGKSYDSVEEAYAQAQANAEENDLIYIGGSTFVVAEIL